MEYVGIPFAAAVLDRLSSTRSHINSNSSEPQKPGATKPDLGFRGLRVRVLGFRSLGFRGLEFIGFRI